MVEVQLQVQMLHRRNDTAFLILCGNDDGKQRQGWTVGRRGSHGSLDQSNHCGFFSAWVAISSAIASSEVAGLHCQALWARVVSSTIHGVSYGRSQGSESIEWTPKRRSHHWLSWVRDRLFFRPPATLTIWSGCLAEYSICLVRSEARSLGWR